MKVYKILVFMSVATNRGIVSGTLVTGLLVVA